MDCLFAYLASYFSHELEKTWNKLYENCNTSSTEARGPIYRLFLSCLLCPVYVCVYVFSFFFFPPFLWPFGICQWLGVK